MVDFVIFAAIFNQEFGIYFSDISGKKRMPEMESTPKITPISNFSFLTELGLEYPVNYIQTISFYMIGISVISVC